jgi:hypothetical protein
MSLVCFDNYIVHARQDDVGEQHVHVALRKNPDRLIRVACGQYAEALFGERANDDIAHRSVVFNDQNADKR